MIESIVRAPAWAPIVAVENVLASLFGQGESRLSSDVVLAAATIAVAVLLAAFALWHARRHVGRRSYDSPAGLFRELCAAHQLDRADRRLLQELAERDQLDDPARLFLEPERFEPAQLDPELACRTSRFVELRDKLFVADESLEANVAPRA